MAEIDVLADANSVCKLQPVAGETANEFVKRLALKAYKLKEDDWATLEEKTQLWINDVLEAIEAKKNEYPIPEGVEAYLAPVDASAPAVKPGKAKSNGASKPKKEAAGRKGPKGKYKLSDVITLKAKENPFRKGSKCEGWFGKIKDGMTVEQAVTAGAPRNHIRWAATLGHLEIKAPK